jgi:hypothetical protein
MVWRVIGCLIPLLTCSSLSTMFSLRKLPFACIIRSTCRYLCTTTWTRHQWWWVHSLRSWFKYELQIWFEIWWECLWWACRCWTTIDSQLDTYHPTWSRIPCKGSNRSEEDEVLVWGTSSCTHNYQTSDTQASLYGSSFRPIELCKGCIESLVGSGYVGWV